MYENTIIAVITGLLEVLKIYLGSCMTLVIT